MSRSRCGTQIVILSFTVSILYTYLQRFLCLFLATMAWVVGMADDENKDAKASDGKQRKKQKPPSGKFMYQKDAT